MKKLLSLPPNLVGCFHDITGYDKKEWFCSNDPIGKKLGSGGGTTWLLQQACREDAKAGGNTDFDQWLASDKRLILHAGGQSRRSVGKDTDPDTGVPLGTRTTLVAGFAFAADSAIQADYGCRTGQVAHDDCEW